MLDSKKEYQKMFESEKTHWWYKSLHRLILESMPAKKEVRILDAGCGTGGLMNFLKQHGYENIEGFDLSEYALDYCKKQGLEVKKLGLLELQNNYEKTFDVIILSDVLYFLTKKEQKDFFEQAHNYLSTNGIILLNVPALKAFEGIHDRAVGIKERFDKKELFEVIDPKQFTVINTLFWPFLLSPLVFCVRTMQKVQLTLNKNTKITSDVSMPPKLLNNLLYSLVSIENKMMKTKPFGSSLFVIFEKN